MADAPTPGTPEGEAPATHFLRWPPPGLERMQGDLWRVASRGALAGALLVLPILFVVTREHDFASLGPFADAWWVTLILAVVGLGFALDALTTASRTAKRISKALERGYDWKTIGFVLADLRRDMGFLLQGGRHFGVMDARERSAIAGLRLVAVSLHAAAGVWLPVALAGGLFLGAREAIGPSQLWMITLVPALILYLLGGAAGAAEDSRVRRARKEWHKQPWASDLVTDEIDAWRRDLADHHDGAPVGSADSRLAPFLRRLAILFGAVAVVVAIPVLTLVPTSGLGPMLAGLAVPSFGQAQLRSARAEALRPYRVAPDPSISPQEAGSLLQVLLFVGSPRRTSEGEREPARRVEASWLPGPSVENPIGVAEQLWAEAVFDSVANGASAELLEYLRALAAHEGHADFSRLASAGEVDVASGRWPDPFPYGVSLLEVPIPRFSALRTGAHAHIAAAAYELSQGNADVSEQMIREVVSLGLLLGDDGPMLIDNMIGHTVARTGGTALAAFYEATGRSAEATRLRELEGVALAAASRIADAAPQGMDAMIRALPEIVSDTSLVRGLRWEYFMVTTTLAPCLNLSRMVFGPDASYSEFVERARSTLVRFPSEEQLFELARSGYLGALAYRQPGIIGRMLAVSMRTGDNSCGQIMQRIRALDEFL